MLLKGSIKKVIDLILYLQLIKCILIYDMNLPANVLIVLTELRKIIEFEALKPKNLLPLIWSDDELKKLNNKMSGLMTTSLVDSNITSGSFIANLG